MEHTTQIQYIKDNPYKSIRQIAKELGINASTLKSRIALWRQHHDLGRGEQKPIFTTEEIAYLQEHLGNTNPEEIAKHFNVTKRRILEKISLARRSGINLPTAKVTVPPKRKAPKVSDTLSKRQQKEVKYANSMLKEKHVRIPTQDNGKWVKLDNKTWVFKKENQTV